MDYENGHLLWSVEDLRDRLGDTELVALDLRPPEDFAMGHIPGAGSLDIFGISLIDTRPEPLAAFLWIIEHLIGAKGVSTDSLVVVYDRISGERGVSTVLVSGVLWSCECAFAERRFPGMVGGI